jgi:hypothetical protein
MYESPKSVSGMIVSAVCGSSSAHADMAHDSPAAIRTPHRAPDIHADSIFMPSLRKGGPVESDTRRGESDACSLPQGIHQFKQK